MTAILTLTVLFLIAISLWQVAKIFEMSQPSKNNTQVANDRDNDIQGKLMFAFLAFLYILTLYSSIFLSLYLIWLSPNSFTASL